MRPGKNGLVGDPSCAGCRKRCKFNSQAMAPQRAEERNGLGPYGCNSSLRPIVARKVIRSPALSDIGAVFQAAAKAARKLGEALAAHPVLQGDER